LSHTRFLIERNKCRHLKCPRIIHFVILFFFHCLTNIYKQNYQQKNSKKRLLFISMAKHLSMEDLIKKYQHLKTTRQTTSTTEANQKTHEKDRRFDNEYSSKIIFSFAYMKCLIVLIFSILYRIIFCVT
jgi:hypothetical protein